MSGDSHDFSYQNNIGGLNVTASYKDSEFGDFDIPAGAIAHHEEEHEDEEHTGEEHEGEEHEGEEHEEDLGYLPNSDIASTSKRVGISKTGDWGYIGLSISDTKNLFGVPFHGEGHEEHEGEEEHAGEDEHEGEEEHEGERIFSKTESNVVNLEGSFALGNSLLERKSNTTSEIPITHTLSNMLKKKGMMKRVRSTMKSTKANITKRVQQPSAMMQENMVRFLI